MARKSGLTDKNGKGIQEGQEVLVNGFKYRIVWNELSCGFKLEDSRNGIQISMRQLKGKIVEVL